MEALYTLNSPPVVSFETGVRLGGFDLSGLEIQSFWTLGRSTLLPREPNSPLIQEYT